MRITTRDTLFELQAGESLLEALERTGHHVEYQCRSGYCGSCRVTLRVGRVRYPQPPLAFLRPDEILPCCCIVEEALVLEVERARPVDEAAQMAVPFR